MNFFFPMMPMRQAVTVVIAVGIVLATLTACSLWPSVLPSPPVVAFEPPGGSWRGEDDGGPTPSTTAASSEDVRPFRVPDVPEEKIAELRRRLRSYDAGSPLRDASGDWSYGVNMTFLDEALTYWADEFDHVAAVERLNDVPQYLTAIDGLDIHFWHIESPRGPEAPTILCLHGWPGSVYEFYEVQKLLSERFNLVVPSLPGYGWSQQATKRGLGPVEAGAIFHKLMARLGYRRYYLQGGDWGSIVAQAMTRLAPNGDAGGEVLGVHLNMFQVGGVRAALGTPATLLFGPAEERAKIWPPGRFARRMLRISGYFHEQATRPHTLGVALSDSPAGLAAWILEKFGEWTHCAEDRPRGEAGDDDDDPANEWGCRDPSRAIPMDAMITNLMIYWTTGSATSGVIFYKEFVDSRAAQNLMHGPVDAPVALLEFPGEIFSPPRGWVDWRYSDVVRYRRVERGGHFAAMERPQLLAKDVETFVVEMEEGRYAAARGGTAGAASETEL